MRAAHLRGRGRQKVFRLALVTLAVGLAIVGFACGFDDEGTMGDLVPVPDSSPVSEASLIPMPDAEVPDGTTDAPRTRACPVGLPGPTMIEIPGAGSCIDSTEVTNADYDAFLAASNNGALDAGVPEGGLPAGCTSAVLTTFARKGSADGGAPRYPVARVSWCDAYGYCAFAGKRLCEGPDGGTAARRSGEWYRACSADDTRRYPYADAHVDGVCNDQGLGQPVAVGSLSGCEGGLPGLFDMSGNMQEWVATCDDAGNCDTAGGSFSAGAAFADCPQIEVLARSTAIPETGIRCCADLR